MSLFAGQDRNLPIFSQLVQMEETEAAQFLKERLGLTPDSLEVVTMKQLIVLAKSMGENLVKGLYSRSDLEELTRLQYLFPSRKSIAVRVEGEYLLVHDGEADSRLPEFGPISAVVETRSISVLSRANGLFEYLAGELGNLYLNPNQVRTCDECGHPYQVNRAMEVNRFCSNRCRSRASVRDHRRRKSEGKSKGERNLVGS